MTLSLFWTFIKALPEIIKLLQVIDANLKEAETDRKVTTDIKSIHEAMLAKDPAKLNALFSSK